ncbi:alcohol dehydrogenase catalytic domain-containing protein [Streptosporangium canum]|uniref:alcohol dehydrogenase catalytic domain-containing protein n=1 Tax=Streptosporangium canum TaxID=324952 RepID=UPI00343D6C17
MDMKLEVVVLPVSDVDRAENFYTAPGWRLDAGSRGRVRRARDAQRCGEPEPAGLVRRLHGARAGRNRTPAVSASAHRAATVSGRRQFEPVERERHEPSPGQVRIRVGACGLCHNDVLAAEGRRPHRSMPIVPGHETDGVIEAGGDGVDPARRVGERAGVGFPSGHRARRCCRRCRGSAGVAPKTHQ